MMTSIVAGMDLDLGEHLAEQLVVARVDGLQLVRVLVDGVILVANVAARPEELMQPWRDARHPCDVSCRGDRLQLDETKSSCLAYKPPLPDMDL